MTDCPVLEHSEQYLQQLLIMWVLECRKPLLKMQNLLAYQNNKLPYVKRIKNKTGINEFPERCDTVQLHTKHPQCSFFMIILARVVVVHKLYIFLAQQEGASFSR